MICPNCGFDNLPGAEDCAQCLQDLTHLDLPAPQDRTEKAVMHETVAALKPVRPVTVQYADTVRHAILTMARQKVGAVLVLGDGGKLAGIFSERDVLMRIIGKADGYEQAPVHLFMTPNPETVALDDKLAFALHKMDAGGYRHIPVMQGDRPIGMISVRDVLRYVTSLLSPQGP